MFTLYLKGDTYKHRHELRSLGAEWDSTIKAWLYRSDCTDAIDAAAVWCRTKGLHCSLQNRPLYDSQLAKHIINYANEIRQNASTNVSDTDQNIIDIVTERDKQNLPLFNLREREIFERFLDYLVQKKSSAKLPNFVPDIDFSETVYRSRWILDMKEKS